MPFFIRGRRPEGKDKKPKRGLVKDDKKGPPGKKSKYNSGLDEEITSEEDDEYIKGKMDDNANEKLFEEEEETAQEKKVRLARQYIEELREQKNIQEIEDEGFVAARLRAEVLESHGRLRKSVAESYIETPVEEIKILKSKHQKLPIICLAVSHDGKYIYSASKDCSIVKYGIEGDRLGHIPGGRKGTERFHIGHTSHVHSLAVSTDGKFLASGDEMGFLIIWDPETLKRLKRFKKHRGCVSGLSFRHSSHTLYSSSHDRMVMVWDLDVMAFVENLGGHQDKITSIDSFMRESCITSGGRDQSVIVYVMAEDKQLRFTSPHECVDGVKLVDEKTFISFGQEGSLGIWTTLKKRPHHIVKAAHGYQTDNNQPNWITAADALINTDLVATGSMDGHIRLWKVIVDRGQRKLEPLFTIPVSGIVNTLSFTANGSHLIAGIGQEHKLGRWFKMKGVKNGIVVIPLKKGEEN